MGVPGGWALCIHGGLYQAGSCKLGLERKQWEIMFWNGCLLPVILQEVVFACDGGRQRREGHNLLDVRIGEKSSVSRPPAGFMLFALFALVPASTASKKPQRPEH